MPLCKYIIIKEAPIENRLPKPVLSAIICKCVNECARVCRLKHVYMYLQLKLNKVFIICPVIQDWFAIRVYLHELKVGVQVGYEYHFYGWIDFKYCRSLKICTRNALHLQNYYFKFRI